MFKPNYTKGNFFTNGQCRNENKKSIRQQNNKKKAEDSQFTTQEIIFFLLNLEANTLQKLEFKMLKSKNGLR